MILSAVSNTLLMTYLKVRTCSWFAWIGPEFHYIPGGENQELIHHDGTDLTGASMDHCRVVPVIYPVFRLPEHFFFGVKTSVTTSGSSRS